MLEGNQTCETKQEEALTEERERSRAAIETALQDGRATTEKLASELKVAMCAIFCLHF